MTKYQAIKTAEDVDKVICASFGLTQYGRVLESKITDTQYEIYFEANMKTLKKLGSLGSAICMLDIQLASYSRMHHFKKDLEELVVACKIRKDVHFVRTSAEFIASLGIKRGKDITANILNSWIKESRYSLFPAKKFNFKEKIDKERWDNG